MKSLVVEVLALDLLPVADRPAALSRFFTAAAEAVWGPICDPAGLCGEIQPDMDRAAASAALRGRDAMGRGGGGSGPGRKPSRNVPVAAGVRAHLSRADRRVRRLGASRHPGGSQAQDRRRSAGLTVSEERVPWPAAEPARFAEEQAAMVSVAPGLRWDDEELTWTGPVPTWPFNRPRPATLDEFLDGRQLIVRVEYSQGFPMVAPRHGPARPAA